MLHDMVGDPLNAALLNYRASDDNHPAYMQQLIERESHRDLKWFFDGWVYQDRGLPDFRVVSAYPRVTAAGGYVVTVSVENLGGAGAEVPVTVRVEGGEVTKRLEVRAKSTATTRMEVPAKPTEVVVNDGSVPESNVENNTFKIELTDK
jgi:aminopeptidase N